MEHTDDPVFGTHRRHNREGEKGPRKGSRDTNGEEGAGKGDTYNNGTKTGGSKRRGKRIRGKRFESGRGEFLQDPFVSVRIP